MPKIIILILFWRVFSWDKFLLQFCWCYMVFSDTEAGKILGLRVPSGNATFTTRRIRFPVCRDMWCALRFWWPSKPVWAVVLVQPQQLGSPLPMAPLPDSHGPTDSGHVSLSLHKLGIVPGVLCHCSEIMSEGEQVWSDGKQLPCSSITRALAWVMWGKTGHEEGLKLQMPKANA